jgi:hypothetical protein
MNVPTPARQVFQIEYHCDDCGSITPIFPNVRRCFGCGKQLLLVAVNGSTPRRAVPLPRWRLLRRFCARQLRGKRRLL